MPLPVGGHGGSGVSTIFPVAVLNPFKVEAEETQVLTGRK